jgi:stearoyl-CoA desaturase (delta-9 desaturase)
MDPARSAESFGVITAPGPVRQNRLLNAASIAVPLVGTLVGVLGWSSFSPTAATLWIFLAFFVAETIGLGLGLHRLFTHRAFEIGAVGRAVLGVLGSWGMQGPIDRWVADHRRHHRFTDQPGDPHSPYWVDARKPRSGLGGLWHAHLAWMLTGVVSDKERYAADIRRDPVTRWCSDHYWELAASSLVLPALVGLAAGGPAEAARAFLWAGCFRVWTLQQLTWSVNSLGHTLGTKVAGSSNEARDNVTLALLLFGEGLHSFHHRYPSAAINQPSRLDLNGYLLTLLERAGVVRNLKRYP